MKHKTDTLEGALLDRAVAEAWMLGGEVFATDPANPQAPLRHVYGADVGEAIAAPFTPSTNSAQAESIAAMVGMQVAPGESPVPALRAFVARSFGEEVELP